MEDENGQTVWQEVDAHRRAGNRYSVASAGKVIKKYQKLAGTSDPLELPNDVDLEDLPTRFEIQGRLLGGSAL